MLLRGQVYAVWYLFEKKEGKKSRVTLQFDLVSGEAWTQALWGGKVKRDICTAGMLNLGDLCVINVETNDHFLWTLELEIQIWEFTSK